MANVGGRIGSLEELYDAFAGPLFLYAWRRLGDRGAAEEAVQDTLLSVWRQAHRYDPEQATLATWVFAIAHNVAVDRLRRKAARPQEVASLTAVSDRLTDGDVDRALEAWQLAEALAELSPAHREAVVEVHYRGYTVREAAVRLGVAEGTVKSRLYYGLRALRLRLEEMGVVG